MGTIRVVGVSWHFDVVLLDAARRQVAPDLKNPAHALVDGTRAAVPQTKLLSFLRSENPEVAQIGRALALVGQFPVSSCQAPRIFNRHMSTSSTSEFSRLNRCITLSPKPNPTS